MLKSIYHVASAMNRANIGEAKFQLEANHIGTSPQKVAREVIVPFPDSMTRKLANALSDKNIIGLVGAPGSGKRTLLKQVSSVPIQELKSMRSYDCCHLSQLVSFFQPTLDGPCVWAVQAEQFSEKLIRKMLQKTWPTRIVLISATKIWGLENKDVIYHNIHEKFTREVAKHIGTSCEQLQACGGDLRKLQKAKLMGDYWMTLGSLDKTGHPYFDTKAILNRNNRAPLYYNRAWLEQNILASTQDLQSCANFYESLTCMDINRWRPGEGLCEAEIKAMDNVMIKLAMPQHTHSPKDLERPHKIESVEKTCTYYTAFVRQQKRRAATMEGDSAQARLVQFGDEFLWSHYVPSPCKRQRIEASPSSDSAANNSGQSPNVFSEDVNQSVVCDSPDHLTDKPDVLHTQPEYDLFHGWGLYKTNLREYNSASADQSNFEKYRNAPSDLRNCKWLCIFTHIVWKISHKSLTKHSPIASLTWCLQQMQLLCFYSRTTNAISDHY